MEEGFASVEKKIAGVDARMERGFAAVADDIAEIRATMVTKIDYHAFRQETLDNFSALFAEVTAINKRLDALDEQYKNLKGVTKEIDDVELMRVAVSPCASS